MEYKVTKKENLIKSIIHNVQGISFGQAQKLVRLGNIKVNGKKCKQNIQLEIDDIISIYQANKSMPKVEIVYQDDNILIVNKPQGIECATRDKSSANTYSLEEIFSEYNATSVHRLDRLTEGLVILSKTQEISQKFEKYFRNKNIEKYYKAGIWGTPKSEGIFKAYLKKFPKKNIVEISSIQKDDYKEIVTEFRVEKSTKTKSIVDIHLHTGRTHQIRAHMSYLGYPLINDTKYGEINRNYKSDYPGYFLTAYKLKFNIPDELSYLNNLNIEITPTWLDKLQ